METCPNLCTAPTGGQALFHAGVCTRTVSIEFRGGGYWSILSILLLFLFFKISETLVTYITSCSYLIGVTAAELQWLAAVTPAAELQWHLSLQLSCSDTCLIWTWFKMSNPYFCQMKIFCNGVIREQSFSNPHSRAHRWTRLTKTPYI